MRGAAEAGARGELHRCLDERGKALTSDAFAKALAKARMAAPTSPASWSADPTG
jgi:hypothetical protein